MTNSLLKRLCIVYGQPDSHDPDAYLAEIANMLRGYSEADLQRAGDTLLRVHRVRSFPKPSEIIEACEGAKPTFRPPTANRYPQWSDDAFKRADTLVKCEMGRKAAKEGWILGLHDYCRNHGELPHPYNVSQIKDDADFVARCAAGLVDMGTLRVPLMRMAESFMKRRRALQDMVLGPV